MDKTLLIQKIVALLESCEIDFLVYIELFIRRLTRQ